MYSANFKISLYYGTWQPVYIGGGENQDILMYPRRNHRLSTSKLQREKQNKTITFLFKKSNTLLFIFVTADGKGI
jgi:hypothetical protein